MSDLFSFHFCPEDDSNYRDQLETNSSFRNFSSSEVLDMILDSVTEDPPAFMNAGAEPMEMGNNHPPRLTAEQVRSRYPRLTPHKIQKTSLNFRKLYKPRKTNQRFDDFYCGIHKFVFFFNKNYCFC